MASREACVELPPRTRRIPKMYGTGKTVPRTTSAYAENTRTHQLTPLLTRNYLRVRGEYRIRPSMVAGAWELPPRTRRIHLSTRARYFCSGTTSAYAENTPARVQLPKIEGNYLRVRGEYAFFGEVCAPVVELPPRTRRILNTTRQQINAIGTTSAYAENTVGCWCYQEFHGNYLRVRGEYT